MNPLLLVALMELTKQESENSMNFGTSENMITPQLHMAEIDSDAQLDELNILLTQKDKEIHFLKEKIQNIAKQYDDLREVAEKYKEEASKWHYLFLASGKRTPN